MTDHERRIVRTAKGRVSYREAGSGPALLLMHGIGGNSRSWRRQLEELSGDWRVIAWDAPGYGDTAPADPDLESYAGVAAALLSALDVGRAHVLGHSMGGVIAQGLAGLSADRVDRLVLSGTWTGDGVSGPLGERWTARLDDRRRMGCEAYGRARASAMAAPGASGDIVEELAGIASEVPLAGLQSACLVLHHADTSPMARQFAMPVLVLAGADDRIIAPERSEALAAMIPDARSVRIPGAGHAAYLENPDALQRRGPRVPGAVAGPLPGSGPVGACPAAGCRLKR